MTWILVCNFIFRVHADIRRTLVNVKMGSMPRDGVVSLINGILLGENQRLSDAAVELIVERFYPDMRSMINACQHGLRSPDQHDIFRVPIAMSSLLRRSIDLHSSSTGTPAVLLGKMVVQRWLLSRRQNVTTAQLEAYCRFMELLPDNRSVAEDLLWEELIPSFTQNEPIL